MPIPSSLPHLARGLAGAAALWAGAVGAPGAAAGPAGSPDGDLAKVRAQLVEHYAAAAPSADAVQRTLRALRADGTWPDVDYASSQRGSWPTYAHLSRALTLAQAYRRPGHPLAGSPALREAVARALDHWLDRNYTNPNWWYPRLGMPMTVAPTLLLMGDDLPEAMRRNAMQQVLGRASFGMTGQNRVWAAGIELMRGLLNRDAPLVGKAREEIFDELRITTAEGIQPDWSFHQHGPQLQWGNYGGSFGRDMIRWATILRGTAYALDGERLGVLRGYLTQGPAWIVWKGQMDISGCGRQLFAGAQAGKGQGVLGQLGDMPALDEAQAEAYRSIAAAAAGQGKALDRPGGDLVGHKHYWRSDISVHRRPTWYASVKMSSPRVIGAETCNSENLLGLHLGDGATYFLMTGREYEDIFPVWDWRRLPGTTCRQDAGPLAPSSKRCRGGDGFVGGVTDGRHGLAAMRYVRDGLTARKAWFFADEAVVCLGAGIDCDSPEPVVTTLNQCLLAGPVTVCEAGRVRTLDRGRAALAAAEWVHHAGVAYVLPTATAVEAQAEPKAGDWRSVADRGHSQPARREVFGLYLDHGLRPRDAAYAYVVYPDTTAGAVPALRKAHELTILRNTRAVQAVAAGRLVLAAFHEPAGLTLGGGRSVEVDAPCLVMLEEAASRPAARLCVADPTHKLETLRVRLAGRYEGEGTRYDQAAGRSEVVLALPRDGLAGSTTAVELRPRSAG